MPDFTAEFTVNLLQYLYHSRGAQYKTMNYDSVLWRETQMRLTREFPYKELRGLTPSGDIDTAS